jgi:hypothetical protein
MRALILQNATLKRVNYACGTTNEKHNNRSERWGSLAIETSARKQSNALSRIFQYVSNKMQRYTIYYIWKLLYMLLLPAAIAVGSSKFLSLPQFKTAVLDLLNGHLINGCRRRYLRTKVWCLTMSVLYPASVRVIQTIRCTVSCLYEQWWHSNWLSRGWSSGAPVLSVEAWIWGLLPSRPHRVLGQVNFTFCTRWALFVQAKSDRSMKLTCQIYSFPKSVCVKLQLGRPTCPLLVIGYGRVNFSTLRLCTFLGGRWGEREVFVDTKR